MAQIRVYELANELGVESKTVLARLGDLGHQVRSASSIVGAEAVAALRGAVSNPAQGKRRDGSGDHFRCPCCELDQTPHFNQFDIRDRVCGHCISHQGSDAQLRRAERHEELLRERLAAARKDVDKAQVARAEYKQKMHRAYDSRERAVGYLAKINDLHELRAIGNCGCGKKDCQTAALLYQPWPQRMIRKFDEAEEARRHDAAAMLDYDWD